MRICDRCGTKIVEGEEWYRIESRDTIDANKPSLVTSDLCHRCGIALFTGCVWN